MEKKSKLTYLILGIGIGIIIASTFYSFYSQVEYIDLSDDIIMERAMDLGMVSLKESINVGNPEKEVPKNDNSQIAEDETYIEMEIKKGENLLDIANKLFTLELIDDKEEFILFAEDKMLDKLFAYGTYKIKMNTSYSTIIKVLTNIK